MIIDAHFIVGADRVRRRAPRRFESLKQWIQQQAHNESLGLTSASLNFQVY